jgi:replicative superfamily II helicase
MNIEQNIERLKRIEDDGFVQNLIAQADARYILFNTSESRDNFPNYNIRDGNLTILALYYLEIGCSFAENEDLERAREPLEKGASILEYVHASESNKQEFSNYYSLISALAYYVSFQYSKSFILIGKTQSDTTIISRLVSFFLQRKFDELLREVETMVISLLYTDERVSTTENEIDGADRIYEITIAKSLNGFVRYFQSGNEEILKNAKSNLAILKEISELRSEPSVWWVIRLLLLICDGFNEASLWNSLGKHFDTKSDTLRKYIRSLVYQPSNSIHELFITQRKSLSKVLNPERNGCVVTIPTSSGKTRIAEIAILDSFRKYPDKKILYIAPFRSLAFEIENSLEKILSNVGISSSHLYGGSLFSRLDQKIIEESNVIIATPEKAKAMLRGNNEIANQIRLIIIDEGHLLGAEKRLIVNEIFYEELRFFAEKNGGRFLLLSAVLPNSEDLAQWLTKSKETIYKDTWRPSDERLGILEWTGRQVNLNWMNSDTERPTYNNRFIVRKSLTLTGRQRKPRFFPADKSEAIAAATYKLKTFGPALIYVGRKDSVFTIARAYLKCLKHDANDQDFEWKQKENWKAFELACIETYGETNDWLLHAKKGILCHHGKLHADVRLPLERLMRDDNPMLIVSTSTLGQGVNLGVSSVIFSTIYRWSEITEKMQLMSSRDFWNIAGRAGRAFVDHEAKILIALDKSDSSTLEARNKSSWEQSKAIEFFDKQKIDIASSGILALFRALKRVTDASEFSFELLIQLIAENKIPEKAIEIDNILDWVDDTFLALHNLNNIADGEIDYEWVETFFRQSLAYIQINEGSSFTQEDLISLAKARVKGIVTKVGTDKKRWKSIIKSGIPLNSDLYLEDKLPEIVETLKPFYELDKTVDVRIQISNAIIKIIQEIPVFQENKDELASTNFDEILTRWMKADAFSELLKLETAEKVITDLFSYKLPWIFNGISKKLRNMELEEEAELIEGLAILIEVGLPNLRAVKIYQAGIRSRIYSYEVSKLFENDEWEKSIRDYRADIVSNRDKYKSMVSDKCGEWIDLMSNATNLNLTEVARVPNFKFGKVHEKTDSLIAKKIDDKQHLFSPDFSFIQDISTSKIDFTSVNEIAGIVFNYDAEDHNWKMVIENPYVRRKA